MKMIRRIARPLLAAPFVSGGIETLRNPGPRVEMAEGVGPRVAEPLPLPNDTDQLVKINAVVQVVAGLLLAIGRLPRLAAAALAASLVPTTLAGHRFWEEKDDAQRAQQQIHFLKNAGLLGGLVLASFDKEGAPSLAWRAKRTARRVRKKAA
jgi:putative oxidoreductase